jgi:non-specific serine/threonine protein kinase
MLETVREFAVEQLDESGEAETIGRRHVDWCLTLALEVDTDLSDVELEHNEAQLEAEQANIRAALAWLRDRQLAHDGLRLATAMGGFWGPRSAHAEGGGWMETFLAQSGVDEPAAGDRIRALWWLGQWAAYRGDLAMAQDRLSQSLALAQQVGDKRGISMGLGAVAMALFQHGEVAKSIPILDEAIALAREVGNRRDLSQLLTYVAVAHGHLGDLARAETLAEESVAMVRSFGATRGFESTVAMLFMGWIAFMGDDLDLAVERFGAALSLSQALASKAIQSAARSGLGEVALLRGRSGEAAAHFREGLVMGWESNLPTGMVFNLPGVVRLAIMHGDTRRAARLAGVLETFGTTLETMPAACVRRFRADAKHLQAALGEEAFAAELKQGEALGPAEIVAEALALDEEGTTTHGA